MPLKIDAPGIAQLIQQLVDLSMDGRIAAADQDAFLKAAVTLQQRMLPTLYASFTEGTDEVLELNADIKTANEAIVTATKSLEATKKTFEIVGEVIGDIAAVVKLAAKVATLA